MEYTLEEIVQAIEPADSAWREKASARTAQLVMPTRALGRLHEISERLCGILRTLNPSLDRKAVLVMAGDHGVTAEGISAYPQEVTGAMVRTFLRGGAGINAISRHVGADVYHRDWRWWDRAGDWHGPDFRTINQYLRKHDMGLLIYAFVYTVHGESRVAREPPEWCIGELVDLSQPGAVELLKRQLDEFVERWGDFEWRNDSYFTGPRDGDDTPMLGQDQGVR